MPVTLPISDQYPIYSLRDLREFVAQLSHLPEDTVIEIDGAEHSDNHMQIQLFERKSGKNENGRAVVYDDKFKAIPVTVSVLIFSEIPE